MSEQEKQKREEQSMETEDKTYEKETNENSTSDDEEERKSVNKHAQPKNDEVVADLSSSKQVDELDLNEFDRSKRSSSPSQTKARLITMEERARSLDCDIPSSNINDLVPTRPPRAKRREPRKQSAPLVAHHESSQVSYVEQNASEVQAMTSNESPNPTAQMESELDLESDGLNIESSKLDGRQFGLNLDMKVCDTEEHGDSNQEKTRSKLVDEIATPSNERRLESKRHSQQIGDISQPTLGKVSSFFSKLIGKLRFQDSQSMLLDEVQSRISDLVKEVSSSILCWHAPFGAIEDAVLGTRPHVFHTLGQSHTSVICSN